MKFKILTALPPAAKRLPATEIFPARRRTKFSAGFPVRAELVVFLPLFRVAQNLVGFIEFLEFFLGLFLVPGHVRVVFPRELAKGLLDFSIAGAAGNAENFIIIFVLYG